MPRPVLLDAAQLPDPHRSQLRRAFTVLDWPSATTEVPAFLAAHGASVRGIAVRHTQLDASHWAQMPALEIVSSYTAGMDNLELGPLRERNIALRNTSEVLAGEVASTGVLLVLALLRELVLADAFVRDGRWPVDKSYPLTRSIRGLSVGIVGLGAIGQQLAEHLERLGARIAYHGRTPKPVAYPFFDDVRALARAVDMLIVCCPLTKETHHLVNAELLDLLRGKYLVNLARGPIVDEQALIAAKAHLAGVALDVFEHEPEVPAALRDDPKILVAPHIGSATVQTRRAMADHMVTALLRHFDLDAP